jgi:hypothetical protein
MRSTLLKSLFLAFLVVAVLIVSTAPKALSQQAGGGRLAGTWEVILTPHNCETGVPAPVAIRELSTFMDGGTMLNSTAGLSPALKTPGHGVWNHLYGDTYSFKFKILNFNATTNTFSGWTIVSHELVLNPEANAYTSAGTAEIYNTIGTLLNRLCSSTTGTRFE